MVSRSVLATNSATASENKIHDDEVAKRYGFHGGLVPGVTVFAYLINPIVQRWGPAWVSRGWVDVTFVHPVYDGDTVTTTLDGDHVELRDSTGTLCATGDAGLIEKRPEIPDIPSAPLPTVRPAASRDSLAPGTVLGSLDRGFHAAHAGAYLAQIGEDLPLFTEGVAHPGWLLLDANNVLAANVTLGPWIHTSSRVHHLGTVSDGDLVHTRASVTDCYERRGHQFVEMDVVGSVDERPVTWVHHTAIWQVRSPAGG
jgi:hypothetical protein